MESNYEAYIINPPFVDVIIIKVLDMIEQKLKKSYMQIFLFIPQWDDIFLPWYEKISKQYITNLCKLNKDNSIVYNYIENKPLKANFGTYFIYINNITTKLCETMTIK